MVEDLRINIRIDIFENGEIIESIIERGVDSLKRIQIRLKITYTLVNKHTNTVITHRILINVVLINYNYLCH